MHTLRYPEGLPSLLFWFSSYSYSGSPGFCSPCGSFSCASSSAIAASLLGGLLWLAFRFRIPIPFCRLSTFVVFSVAHTVLTTLFLCFLSMRLFLGDFPLLFTDVFPTFRLLYHYMRLSFLFATYDSFAVAYCFVCLARIFFCFSPFLTFVFHSYRIRASSSSLLGVQ